MAIFSSQPEIDGDPEPWAYLNNHSIRYAERPTILTDKYDHDPRPEYRIPKINPTNPILVAFREREDQRNIYAVRQWLGFVFAWDGSICVASADQITHARLVFRRMLTKLEAGW